MRAGLLSSLLPLVRGRYLRAARSRSHGRYLALDLSGASTAIRTGRCVAIAPVPPHHAVSQQQSHDPERAGSEGEQVMAESVYKIIELVGTSTESWEKAAAAAVDPGIQVPARSAHRRGGAARPANAERQDRGLPRQGEGFLQVRGRQVAAALAVGGLASVRQRAAARRAPAGAWSRASATASCRRS